MRAKQFITEKWTQKYKSSINCSHPRGFSQKAHCAGKSKHNEDITMEMTCPDCNMCETHGNLNEIKKGAKDSNGVSKCWPGKHAAGTKKGKNGGQVRNCVPNESVAEGSNKSEATRRIQKMLNNKYNANLDIDGILGPLTRKSINKFMPNAKTGLADEPNKNTAVQGKQVKEQGVAEGLFGIDDKIKGRIQNVVSDLSDIPGMWDHKAQTFTDAGMEKLKSVLNDNPKYIKYALNLDYRDYEAEGVAEGEKKGLYYNVNKRKAAGTSRSASSPKAPTAQAWKDAAKTAKNESITEDWNKVNHQDKTNGLSQKAVNAYRRENPGSKLKTAVTTKPSKLKAGSKAAKRRKSFCARMGGNKGPMKKPNGKPTPKALALRRWNCESVEEMQQLIQLGESYIANLKENFADGKNPQDKGDSKRHGVPTKASVSTLRNVAKQGGRKGQLAHWMANMKAGKAKK